MQSQPESPFAPVVGLGALKSGHTPSTQSRRNSIITNVLFVALGLALIVAAFIWMAYASSRGSSGGNAFILLCFGCLGVPIGAFGLFSTWRNWQIGAALYENGFAYKDRNGLQQVSWNDIDAVWQSITKHYRRGVYTGATYFYTIQTRDKKKVVLDNKLPGIEQLGNEIVKGSSIALFPRYWQALQSGQRLTFGPLALDKQGLYSGNKSLQWSEIKAIKIQQGVISVKKEGGWFNWASVTVPQIPNFYIFYDLVRRFATVE